MIDLAYLGERFIKAWLRKSLDKKERKWDCTIYSDVVMHLDPYKKIPPPPAFLVHIVF